MFVNLKYTGYNLSRMSPMCRVKIAYSVAYWWRCGSHLIYFGVIGKRKRQQACSLDLWAQYIIGCFNEYVAYIAHSQNRSLAD